jgi:hypothetical protein
VNDHGEHAFTAAWAGPEGPGSGIFAGNTEELVVAKGDPVPVAWDEVEQVGQFLELELTAAQDDLDAARACITALAERLSPGAAERRGYLDMLLSSMPAQSAS